MSDCRFTTRRRNAGRGGRGAFTLVEILIVVVILAILASVVVPIWSEASEDSRRQAFSTNLLQFADGAEVWRARNGSWPADSSTGEFPPELNGYIKPADFTTNTPIGGRWDFENASYGIESGVGVVFGGGFGETRDDAYMQRIDGTIDDGNLGTGLFQKIDGVRYYWVLAP